jgi:transposase
MENNFSFNNELLSHIKSEIRLDNKTFPAHIFLNGKVELDVRHSLIKKLIEIEENVIKSKTFQNQKKALAFNESNIEKAYQEWFKFNRSTNKLKKDTKYVKAKISKFGYFLLNTNNDKLEGKSILYNYRDMDQPEKVFDLLKNELDGARLRTLSQFNTEVRLFIIFLALITLSELIKRMRKADLKKKI